MATHSVRGATAATAATADHAICALWNASSSRRIVVRELGIFKTGAGTAADSLYLSRISARGTAGSTVTPDIDNDWAAASVAASGIIWPCARGISVPGGTGLALCQRAATAWPVSEVYFVWDEV